MRYRIILGYRNTKLDKEDLALTPYLFFVNAKKSNMKAVGLGICWIYSSMYFVITKNLPKTFPTFYKHSK